MSDTRALCPWLDDGDVRLYLGDCVEVMREMPAESVDAVVTDPPYALPGGFMGRSWDNHDGRVDAGACYHLAGLIDGEGCFRVQRHERGTHSCTFSMQMWSDDGAILHRAAALVGAGVVANTAHNGGHPMTRWAVQDKEGCLALVGFLRRFPLRAKKAVDFELWAQAVEEWSERPRGNRWSGSADQTRAAALKARIEAVREFRDIPWSGHRFQDWCREWAEEALRVLKPGGHLLAFGGTRTYHRMACAIEDAGFEIRDSLQWLYGSGFPKSLDVSKAIDREAGAQREKVQPGNPPAYQRSIGNHRPWMDDPDHKIDSDVPATPEAAAWQGWGTALKPSHEPVVVARKPLAERTVARQVLATGTGALNVDATRVGTTGGGWNGLGDTPRNTYGEGWNPDGVQRHDGGRWPPNLLLTHDAACEEGGACAPGCPVAELDRQTAGLAQAWTAPRTEKSAKGYQPNAYGTESRAVGTAPVPYGDAGGASRFFPTFRYEAKADGAERDGATHPTVKPLALMRWLCRLVTPPGGLVLDPFAGSGTTLLAARNEGFRAIGIEREEEYARMVAHRLRQLSLLT